MNLKATLFAAASALVLSAGAAAAVPATAETSLNVRSGPGTQYEIVGSIPAGSTVDVQGCTGSWCRVSFAGGTGFASRSYLAMAGGGGAAVAVAPAPGYVYEDGPYYDDYYDYGYAYGPSVGIYAGGGYYGGWRGSRWDRGRAWNGGGRHWSGGGGWAGRPGGATSGTVTPRQGLAGPPASWQRPGTGIGAGGGGMAGASAGMRGGAAPAAPSGGGRAQGGFAGSIAKQQ